MAELNVSTPQRPSAARLALTSLQYAIWVPLAPLFALGLAYGWVWFAVLAAALFVLMPIADALASHNRSNLDPTLEGRLLIWHRVITWIWAPVQLLMICVLLYTAGRLTTLTTGEAVLAAIMCGVASGGIGITYAHELIHQRNRLEPLLGEILLCSTLYGHFRIEHVYGHHTHVATPHDPATSRRDETIYAFWVRCVVGSFISAWRIQSRQLERKGKPIWSRDNAFWRYLAWTIFWYGLAIWLAGGFGALLFTIQAIVAFSLLELVNYTEHYGLRRRRLANGKYEPTRPHHSWNANHRISNFLLINLQRHSDHHFKPDRRFPVLQAIDEKTAPQLPVGYATMVLAALIPPLYFRIMNPRVDAWEKQFYPEGLDQAPSERAR